MAYDRSKAREYASRFYNRPCADGWIVCYDRIVTVHQERVDFHAPASDWDAVFDSNPESLYFVNRRNPTIRKTTDVGRSAKHPLDDCTHYAGECLRKGGIPVPQETKTPKMVERLKNRGEVKTLAELADENAAQRVMATGMLKEGDVIAYFRGGDYEHMAVRVGPNGITSHTRCRFGDDWNLGSYLFTFLHFGNDVANSDAPLIAPFAQAMRGWWVVRGGAGLRFYYFLDDGRVRSADSAPVTQTPPPPSADNSGYWFHTDRQLLLFWSKGGALLEFAATGSPERFTGVVGDLTKLHATS